MCKHFTLDSILLLGLLTQSDLECSGISSDRKDLSTINRSYLDFDLYSCGDNCKRYQSSIVYTMTPSNNNK